MAAHVLGKCCRYFFRAAHSRPLIARSISMLACRSLLATESTNLQSVFASSHPLRHSLVHVKLFSDAPSLTAEELGQRTLEVIKSFDKVDPEKVTVDAHFINDMGLDSLDVVDILMALEDEFGVEISDEQAEKIFTPKEAIDFMKTFLDIHDH